MDKCVSDRNDILRILQSLLEDAAKFTGKNDAVGMELGRLGINALRTMKNRLFTPLPCICFLPL